ncbi:MAG: hypothetical protein E7012_01475 [Alphaproteobacteria bacterium]|nr:hypothetical protein [Alphaproteobacteria bacterium]
MFGLLILLGIILVVVFSQRDIFLKTVRAYDIQKAETPNEYLCKFYWRGKERNGLFVSEVFDIKNDKFVIGIVTCLFCEERRWAIDISEKLLNQNSEL